MSQTVVKMVKMSLFILALYFSDIDFSFVLFFDREHAETLRNGIKSEKKGDLTHENDQNVIFRSKWAHIGSKWVKMTLFIFDFVFSDIDFLIFAFFDREHAETSRNGIKSDKICDLTPQNDQNVIFRPK